MLERLDPAIRAKVMTRLTDKRRIGDILETMALNHIVRDYGQFRDLRQEGLDFVAFVRETPDSAWTKVRFDGQTGRLVPADTVGFRAR